jgi:hypothetical protein
MINNYDLSINFGNVLRIHFAVILILIIVWCNKAEGGFNTTANLFSWHALGMTLAFPVCMTEAVLACKITYRHIIFNCLTVVFTIFGLVAIIYYKKLEIDYNGDMGQSFGTGLVFPYFTLYSVHSWLGILTLILFVVQAFLSKISKDIHKKSGKLLYVFGLICCVTGLGNMQSSDLAGDSYPPYSTESLLAPAASLVLFSLGTAYYIKYLI